jgi:hypothetical protein
MDGCALVSSNGGWNLAIGALTTTGRFVALTGNDGCKVVTGQVQQDRCWAKVGRDQILSDPLRWLSLIPKKLAHTYNHESFAVAYLAETNPSAWPEARKAQARNILTGFHQLLMLAASFSVLGRFKHGERWHFAQAMLLAALATALALAANDPEYPFFWLLVCAPLLVALRLRGAPPVPKALAFAWGMVAMTSITHAVFFGDDRYHITVSPLLCVLAAGLLRLPARDLRVQKSQSPTLALGEAPDEKA